MYRHIHEHTHTCTHMYRHKHTKCCLIFFWHYLRFINYFQKPLCPFPSPAYVTESSIWEATWLKMNLIPLEQLVHDAHPGAPGYNPCWWFHTCFPPRPALHTPGHRCLPLHLTFCSSSGPGPHLPAASQSNLVEVKPSVSVTISL